MSEPEGKTAHYIGAQKELQKLKQESEQQEMIEKVAKEEVVPLPDVALNQIEIPPPKIPPTKALEILQLTSVVPTCEERGFKKEEIVGKVDLGKGARAQHIEICRPELDDYIRQRRLGEEEQYRKDLEEVIKDEGFKSSVLHGHRRGRICFDFTMVFMKAFNQFLKDNRNALCSNPRQFYSNCLRKVLEYYREKKIKNEIVKFLYDLLVRQINILPTILALVSLPLLPFCALGFIPLIIDIVTVIIGFVTDILCSKQRLDVTNTVFDILKILHIYRPETFKKYYPQKIVDSIKKQATAFAEKVKLAKNYIKQKAAYAGKFITRKAGNLYSGTMNLGGRFTRGVSSGFRRLRGLPPATDESLSITSADRDRFAIMAKNIGLTQESLLPPRISKPLAQRMTAENAARGARERAPIFTQKVRQVQEANLLGPSALAPRRHRYRKTRRHK